MGWVEDMVRFQTFEQIHNKQGVGSTRIRVHNLIKYWPEAGLYQYGEDPDVLIFQKVYVTDFYTMPIHFKKLKILDICDPDWLSPDAVFIKRTVDVMDAVTCPTQPIADFVSQLTDKPVRVIKDRFDLSEVPSPKVHKGEVKQVVWFGYSHNAECLKTAVPLLSRMGIKLMVISDQDPQAWRWASHDAEVSKEYRSMYTYKKYEQATIYSLLQRSDVCILPKSWRPRDRYKSENKTVVANLAGLPVAFNDEDLEKLKDLNYRARVSKEEYDKAIKEYDCKKSVEEYQDLIKELSTNKT